MRVRMGALCCAVLLTSCAVTPRAATESTGGQVLCRGMPVDSTLVYTGPGGSIVPGAILCARHIDGCAMRGQPFFSRDTALRRAF